MISFSSVHMQQGQELVNRWALGSNRKAEELELQRCIFAANKRARRALASALVSRCVSRCRMLLLPRERKMYLWDATAPKLAMEL